MPNFHFERQAIERVLARLETETPPWRRERIHTRLATQRDDYEPATERIRFVGVSRPNLAPSTTRTRVGVFIPRANGEGIALVPRDSDWADAVIIRDPTEAERAACSFRDSAVRVAEAIDVISGGPGVLFRSLGVVEYFVAV